jgi:hypothetical protein
MSVQEITFGQNDSGFSSKKKPWKAKGGENYCISFIFLKDIENGLPDLTHKMPRFCAADTHYFDKVGNVVVTPEIKAAVLANVTPRPRLATAIAIWPLTPDGDVDTQALHRAEVLPWVFSPDKYEDLKRIHKNFNLIENDILVTCENTEFQKMKFMPKPKGILYSLATSEKTAHRDFAAKLFDKARPICTDIKSYLGHSYTLAQLREKLGSATASGGPGVSAPTIPDNLDETVSGFLDS